MTNGTDQSVVLAVEPDMAEMNQNETGSDLGQLLDGDVVARLTKDAQKAGIPLSGDVRSGMLGE